MTAGDPKVLAVISGQRPGGPGSCYFFAQIPTRRGLSRV
jgi:hypothetical protein